MFRKIVLVIIIIIGLFMLFNDTIFQSVYAKIAGLVLVMFSIFKIQSKIPSKTENKNLNNSEDE